MGENFSDAERLHDAPATARQQMLPFRHGQRRKWLTVVRRPDLQDRHRPRRPAPGPRTGPARAPGLPRIIVAFNHATGPLRAKDVCEALGHELLPKNVEGTRAKLKRLVKLGILTEADTGKSARKQ